MLSDKHNTETAYRNVNTINKLFTSNKDRDETDVKFNVVLKILRHENCGQKYYYVKRRACRHKFSCDKIVTNKHDSAASTQLARVHDHTF